MVPLTCKRVDELRQLFQTCSSDEFKSFWEQWFDELVSTINVDKRRADTLPTSVLIDKSAILLLERFFEISQQFPAVSRELSVTYLPQFAQKISILDDGGDLSTKSLRILKLFLSYYPNAVAKYTKLIRSGLCKCMDKDGPSRDVAAKCFALLPNVGPSGENRSKHTESWITQFNSVLIEIHRNLHTLDDVVVIDGKKSSSKLCKFNAAFETSVQSLNESNDNNSAENLHNRLDFYLTCVSYMVTYPFRFQVSIPVNSVMELFRCFTNVLSNNTIKNAKIGRMFREIQKSFLRFFVAVPTLVGFTFSIYAADVYDLLLLNLHTLSRDIVADDDIYCIIYNILQSIVANCGATSKFQGHVTKFWRYMEKDLLLLSYSATTVVDNSPASGYHGNQHKKRKLNEKESALFAASDRSCVVMTTSSVSISKRFESCCQLLTTVCQQLGVTLKPNFYRELQALTCRLALNMQTNDTVQLNTSLLSNDAQCRLSIYHLISAIVTCRHPTCPPAVQVGMQIFQRGCRDSDITVSNACQNCMQILNCICKPMVPGLECVKSLEDVHRRVEQVDDDDLVVEDDQPSDGVVVPFVLGTSDFQVPSQQTSLHAVSVTLSDDAIVVNIDSEPDDDVTYCRSQPATTPVTMETVVSSVAMGTAMVAKRFKSDSSSFVKLDRGRSKILSNSVTETPVPDCLLDNSIKDMMVDFTDQLADS